MTAPTIDPICLYLRAERERQGLSQGKVAELAGTSRETINLYENGKVSPTLAFLRRWADALNVTLTPASSTLAES